MGLGNPSYITLPSSGGVGASFSPWQKVDDFRNPVNLSFSIYSSSVAALSSQASIQVTMDDPFGYFSHPFSSPGQGPGGPSSSPFVSVFQSSALGAGNTINQSSGAIGSITVPITAWRVANSSSAGTVIVTALQSGPR